VNLHSLLYLEFVPSRQADAGIPLPSPSPQFTSLLLTASFNVFHILYYNGSNNKPKKKLRQQKKRNSNFSKL
jgi:hypothetical protein